MFKNENYKHWLHRIKILAFVAIILVFVVLFIIELKHVYKIDVFPGYNGIVDDIYFKIKEIL